MTINGMAPHNIPKEEQTQERSTIWKNQGYSLL
jgi:hypothetical protein